MAPTRTRVFISYSRLDSEFVDKLDVSLKSRGFDTWVDRRKLEGGQDWPDELQRAIEGSQVLALVLSPTAIASPNVKTEYRHALHQGLVVIPLLYKAVERVPMDLNYIEWVDFQGDYANAVTNLVNALALARPTAPATATPAITHQPRVIAPAYAPANAPAAPTPPVFGVPEPALAAPNPARPAAALSLKELYDKGDAAFARGNLEDAAIFFQQIIAANPNYLNGQVAKDMQALSAKLREQRIESLRADARQAQQAGEWGRELTDWQALLVLTPADSLAKAGVTNAKHNLNYVDMYAIARDRMNRGELDLARRQLTILWGEAPYYGDPDHLARRLGMTVPPPYEIVADREAKTGQLQAQRESEYLTRSQYIKEKLFESAAAPIWIVLVCFLAALGWGVSQIILALVGSGRTSLLDEAIVAVVAIVVVWVAAYFAYLGGYRQAISPGAMAGIGALASVLALGALAIAPVIAATAQPLGGYHYLFLGALHVTSARWEFAWLFTLTFAVLGMILGLLVGAIIALSIEDDALPGAGAGLLFGLIFLGLGGLPIGVFVGFFGWLVSGAIVGAVVGLLSIGMLTIDDAPQRVWIQLGVAAGVVVALALWLVCWFPFGIDSAGVAAWGAAALGAALAMAGAVLSVIIWVRRASPPTVSPSPGSLV